MIYTAVKTEARAIEVIEKELEFNGIKLSDGVLSNGVEKCECGDTSSIEWIDMTGSCSNLFVVICDCCGDDSIVSDVLNRF